MVNNGPISKVNSYVHPDMICRHWGGVVLVEIGRIKSFIEHRWKKECTRAAEDPDGAKKVLVERAKALRVSMGGRNAKAVLACLRSDPEGEEFLNSFRVQICEKLGEIVV